MGCRCPVTGPDVSDFGIDLEHIRVGNTHSNIIELGHSNHVTDNNNISSTN